MGNPFQDQLLKAGLVTKKQVNKANQDKTRKNKQQPKNKKGFDEEKQKNQQAAQQAATDKATRDRELNKKKELQARQKAISIEINQLIENNCLARDQNCEIVYNFEHSKKIKRIYINAEMQQQIVQGKLGIARVEGGYEIVPLAIAEKIQQRNAKRVVIFVPDENENENENQDDADNNDPYADYQIPDDLQW